MRWEELDQQPCSLSRALSVIGDRWTLLVLRDCFLGIRRFDAFERRLGVTRHVLADRLRKLVDAGVLTRVVYQLRPLREEYRLTEKGRDLHPVILTLVHWGDKHMVDERGAPVLHRHKGCGSIMRPVVVCSECGEAVGARDVTVEAGPSWSETGVIPEPVVKP